MVPAPSFYTVNDAAGVASRLYPSGVAYTSTVAALPMQILYNSFLKSCCICLLTVSAFLQLNLSKLNCIPFSSLMIAIYVILVFSLLWFGVFSFSEMAASGVDPAASVPWWRVLHAA
jgi:hypothetical protein